MYGKMCPARMELPNQNKIRTLGEKETFKYLGMLEADTIKTSGSARGVMVITVGNGHSDTCSNPGRD